MTLVGNKEDFLGRGWHFPMSTDGRGGIALSAAEADIDASIMVILGTAKGERVMRPEFGSSIHDFVFAPNNTTTAGLLSYHVQEALARWEPRIDVAAVNVQPDSVDQSRVLIEVQYIVRATNDERNLVYPFYLIPAEEPVPLAVPPAS